VWRGPKKTGMIQQFITQVAWGELDYLIVDTPPGTSDEHLAVVESLRSYKPDGAVLVTTPQVCVCVCARACVCMRARAHACDTTSHPPHSLTGIHLFTVWRPHHARKHTARFALTAHIHSCSPHTRTHHHHTPNVRPQGGRPERRPSRGIVLSQGKNPHPWSGREHERVRVPALLRGNQHLLCRRRRETR
jgi:hypothetical protein